ncbi:hypothetical protein L210DRAFT_3649327 [Boletus edulis BED1]|uniref:HNH nuclease domain-containing protein n=1 Tax=Boletus edulis BED1 TaxID=1328754 RepID=A0AAD4BLU1_BOLED|nr:hypothetical protein L210DRAFT_3649327 [Boletus edulis BED1]
MGEQSTSLSAVDQAAWTGQVENNGTQEVDKANLDINVPLESTTPQQPESSMPPKSRSQTARSQLSTLPILEEGIETLELGDDIPSRAQQSSPEYDPAAERRDAEGIATNTTPRRRKMKTSTIRTEQREGALKADPHEGRCLITNRPKPVDLCHLVARATDHETLTKLEYVWEEGYLQLNVDSKRNLLHLRADWHRLFDTSEWMLVPQGDVIQKLKEFYLEKKCKTKDLAKLFAKKSYRYYVLPSPTLKEPICRWPDVNGDNHVTLFPPFADLGLLESHIHPQFVIFNTGQKLRDLPVDDILQMVSFLQEMLLPEDRVPNMLNDMLRLYRAWTKANIPADYCNLTGTSKRTRPPAEGGQDDRSQHDPPPKREGLRSATRSQGQGSQGAADRYAGGQQRAILPFRPPEDSEDDSSSITDDTVVEDDTDWIEYIHTWQKESDGVAGKWESGELHDSRDEQLTAYSDEHARTPPSPGVWDSWKPTWGSPSRDPKISDRSRFSSNDWAVFKNDVYLTRLEYPQVDL